LSEVKRENTPPQNVLSDGYKEEEKVSHGRGRESAKKKKKKRFKNGATQRSEQLLRRGSLKDRMLKHRVG